LRLEREKKIECFEFEERERGFGFLGWELAGGGGEVYAGI